MKIEFRWPILYNQNNFSQYLINLPRFYFLLTDIIIETANNQVHQLEKNINVNVPLIYCMNSESFNQFSLELDDKIG